MLCGDRDAVPGDPDEADQALVPGSHRRLERAARRERGPPLVLLDQVVQLDQVDPVGAQPFERAVDLGPGLLPGPLAGLGGQEVLVAVLARATARAGARRRRSWPRRRCG